MNEAADLDLLGVLVVRRERLLEVAGVLRRYGLTSFAERFEHAGGLGHQVVQRLVDAAIDPAIAAQSTGARLRGALTELGTTAVKLGQVLSLRPDVVGPDVASELTRLQGGVAADPPGHAEALVRAELGADVSELFAEFETVPMASGSVAQVHRAALPDGTRVVVKVLHADVRPRVLADLELLRALAVWAEAVSPAAHRLNVAPVVADFDRSMRDAVDLGRELENLERFRAMFADREDVAIPTPYRDRSSASVLTMEEMTGATLTDAASVQAAGWSPDELALRTADLYLTMMFKHGTYHTDPHPGNFLLEPGRITVLDFGDVARLSPSKRRALEDLVAAFGGGDAQATAEALLRMTDAPPDVDAAAVADDLGELIDEQLAGGIDSIDLAGMTRGLVAVVRTHDLALAGDVALVLRVITLLQGLAARIGANIDLAAVSRPFALDAARRRLDPKATARRALRTGRAWEQLLETLPGELQGLLGQVRSTGGVNLHLRDPDGVVDRLVDGLLTAALVLTAGELVSRGTGPTVRSLSLPGLAVAATSWFKYQQLRSRRAGAVSAVDRLRLAERVVRAARHPSAARAARPAAQDAPAPTS